VFLALPKNLLSESPPVLLTYSPVGAQGTAPGLTTSAMEAIVGESILGDHRLGDRLRVDRWFGDLL
jgi:hypothetical protein